MPPRGLTHDRVIDAAAALADRDGLDAVTLAAVAAAVGVRTPSLYNHVDGLPGLRRALALRGVQALGEALRRASVGRSGGDAVAALATAYRDFAVTAPGLHAATVAAPDPEDADLLAASAEVVEVVVAVLRGFGLGGDDAVHAARALRSTLHGFVALEVGGGFGLDVDVDASFRWTVAALVRGLDDRRPPPRR